MYTDKTVVFQELLDKDNSVSVHISNIQTTTIDMYKVANDVSPEIINEVFNFHEKIGYEARHHNIFRRP